MKHSKTLVLIVLLCTLWSCSDWSGTPDNEISPVTIINEITVTPDTAVIGELIKLEVIYLDQDNPNFSVYWSTTAIDGESFSFQRTKPSYLIPIKGKYDSSAVFFDTNYFLDTSLTSIKLYRLRVIVGDTTLAKPLASSYGRAFSIFINH